MQQTLSLADLPVPALVVTADGTVLAANAPAGRLFDCVPDDLLGRPVDALLDRGVEGLLRGDRNAARLQATRLNGVPIVVDCATSPLDDGALALLTLHELNHALLTSEASRYFDTAFDVSPIGMALFNSDGEYIRVNAALCDMLGRPSEQLLGTRDQLLTHPDDRAADVEAAWRILRGEIDTWQTEKRFLRPDGSIIWAIANLTFLRDEEGRPLSWVGQFQDVTERREQARKLRHLAEHDALTDLLNRRGFEVALERTAATAARYGAPGALLLLDLDRFKPINDAHGHAEGDRVLCAVADCLRDLRGEDVVGRLGGDEFAVLLARATPHEAEAVARRLIRTLSALSFDGELTGRHIATSIGIAMLGRGCPLDAASLLRNADRAMYRAKSGRCGVALAA